MVGTAAITEDMLKRRWSASILRYLEKGVTDPAEITKNEANLTASIMSQRLRTMLRYGLIARFPRPPPSRVVEFRLTLRGRKILKMLDIIERLDELDPRLTPNGRAVEEDLDTALATLSDRSPRSKPPFSDQPIKSKKSNGTVSPLPAPMHSSP